MQSATKLYRYIYFTKVGENQRFIWVESVGNGNSASVPKQTAPQNFVTLEDYFLLFSEEQISCRSKCEIRPELAFL